MINHIVEHYPPGTIYNLIKPLATNYDEHKIYLIDSEMKAKMVLNMIKNNRNEVFVLHATGRNLYIFKNIEKVLNNFNIQCIYIYMHVSYDYLKYNKRFCAIKKLKRLSKKGIKVICPSNKVSDIFNLHNIKSITISPGIEVPKEMEYNENLSKYYGKIISTCTKCDNKYQKVKGIKKVNKILKKNNWQEYCLFLGSNLQNKDIESVKLSHDDFLNVLCHSLVYIQLSQYESYNITAIEAKQLKIPIILSAVEGHFESSAYGILVNNVDEAEEILKDILNKKFDYNIVYNNYIDSINNESIKAFYERFAILEEK